MVQQNRQQGEISSESESENDEGVLTEDNDLSDDNDSDSSAVLKNMETDDRSTAAADTTQPKATTPDEQVTTSARMRNAARNAKIRDLLILKEINTDGLVTMLPSTCQLIFPDPNELHKFNIKVTPNEGYWLGGSFLFDVIVPDEYNFEPPKVKCTTKLWHPNITEDGAICLSILRNGDIDANGWNPARQLKDVVLGINSLFTDLVDFTDPLNTAAAELFQRDQRGFQEKVDQYIQEYANTSNSA